MVQALVHEASIAVSLGDEPKIKQSRVENTIFGCNPGLVVFDEAADYRNKGKKLEAAIALSMQAESTLLLMATPLITRASVSEDFQSAI